MINRRSEAENVKRTQIRVTDEQFALLWEHFPLDVELIETVCRAALIYIRIPNKTGRWPLYDVRVYYDNGHQGSGYLLVHWDDAGKVPGCQSNGYCTDPRLQYNNMVWDEQPERERLLSIQATLMEWAY